jgi:hypothetical protein
MLCIFALFCDSLRLVFFSYRFRHVLFPLLFSVSLCTLSLPLPLCLNVFLVLYSFLLFCVPCPLFISFQLVPSLFPLFLPF